MVVSRGLKNRKYITSSVGIALLDQLDELSKTTRIPKSKLLDEAIEDLLKKHGVKPEKGGKT